MSLFKGKTLMITGGTGSFGNVVQERLPPSKFILISKRQRLSVFRFYVCSQHCGPDIYCGIKKFSFPRLFQECFCSFSWNCLWFNRICAAAERLPGIQTGTFLVMERSFSWPSGIVEGKFFEYLIADSGWLSVTFIVS